MSSIVLFFRRFLWKLGANRFVYYPTVNSKLFIFAGSGLRNPK